MAWIESHTVLARHRKTLELALDFRVKPVQIIGHLHALWHTVLEQQEDGDLSRWSDALIAQSALWEGEPSEFVARLRERGWIDGALIHDWIDYVGPYLIKKYSSGNPSRLKEIWSKHGYKYGKGQGKYAKQKATPKRAESERKERIPFPSLPNPSSPEITKPNLTVVVKSARERALGELEALSLSEELQSWAQREFGVLVPEDVVDEFKAYWREQKKLRTDWIATLKSRIRQLVGRGLLKPPRRDVFAEFAQRGEA